MPPTKFNDHFPDDAPSSVLREDGIESGFIGTLQRSRMIKEDGLSLLHSSFLLPTFPDPGKGYTKTPALAA